MVGSLSGAAVFTQQRQGTESVLPALQTNIDDCVDSPCQNGGTCTDGINAYTCTCAKGFTGSTCATAAVKRPARCLPRQR